MAVRELPRLRLAALPTPLVRAERLEVALSAPPIWVKRDDLTGFALAGNKARKLEFLVADALERGCDVVITGGGPGSNHCQAAAAAARVAGLTCRLVMYGEEPARAPTNLRLARAFGADVSFTGDPARPSVGPSDGAPRVPRLRHGTSPGDDTRGGGAVRSGAGRLCAGDGRARRPADGRPGRIHPS